MHMEMFTATEVQSLANAFEDILRMNDEHNELMRMKYMMAISTLNAIRTKREEAAKVDEAKRLEESKAVKEALRKAGMKTPWEVSAELAKDTPSEQDASSTNNDSSVETPIETKTKTKK